jgi:predicted DNA-binding transcriptional regulator AlpA
MSPNLSDLPPGIAEKRILGTAAAAAFVGVSVPTWERLRAAGKAPPAVRLSDRRNGYQVAALIAWIEARTERAGA